MILIQLVGFVAMAYNFEQDRFTRYRTTPKVLFQATMGLFERLRSQTE